MQIPSSSSIGPDGQHGRSGHGLGGWPRTEAVHCDPRPDRLPGGRAWPCLAVLVPAGPGGEAAAASVAAEAYPELRLIRLAPGDAPQLSALLADERAEALLLLEAGESLVPGALAALVLARAMTGAALTFGLTLHADTAPRALCLLAEPALAGPGDGSGCLVDRRALRSALGGDKPAPRDLPALIARLAVSGAPSTRIGRPVRITPARPPEPGPALALAILTDSGPRGGAGIAQRRLAEALALCGHAAEPVRLDEDSASAAAEWTDVFPRAEARIAGRAPAYDLVLAGNLHGATRSLDALGRVAERVPTALVLHDLFALTGRCAHPKACGLIATGCDARCPSPDQYPQLGRRRIAGIHARKRAVLARGERLLLLANSDWTLGRAKALAPPGAVSAPLRLALPTGVFRPQDRAALRRALGLPPDDVLVVFGAVIADAPEKGFADLAATLQACARPGVGFVALGRLDDPAALGVANLHLAGPVADEGRLAQWMAACDIHLTASRLETLGQTAIEAGLCGLPSVAYRATGLTSAVLHEVTGLCAEPLPGALARALNALIADGAARARYGATARLLFESRHSHAAAVLSLHEALRDWGAGPALTQDGRLVFGPELLARFAFAAERDPGATGTVDAPSPASVRRLRSLKRRLFGERLPLPLRRGLYLAALARRRLTGAP